LCSKLLHDCPLGPGGREGPHVLEIPRRKALHVDKGLAQVGGEAVDHLGSPAGAFLAVEDHPAEVPVQQHHRRIGGEDDAQPLLLDALLDLGERLGIVARHPGQRWGYRKGSSLPGLPA
jgi:hypothetical protein